MELRTALSRRPPRMHPLVFFISTGGHVLFLLLLILEIHFSQARRPASAYSVALVSPDAKVESSVFPKPEEKDRDVEAKLTETMLVEQVPAPLPESPPKIPPGLSDPKDCMLKKVTDICPNADLSCIAGYVAYCVKLS